MYLVKETSYNKREHSVLHTECLPVRFDRHLSYLLKCHFFISITIMVRRDKMIAMYLRTFIIKILFFIFITSNLTCLEADTQ